MIEEQTQAVALLVRLAEEYGAKVQLTPKEVRIESEGDRWTSSFLRVRSITLSLEVGGVTVEAEGATVESALRNALQKLSAVHHITGL